MSRAALPTGLALVVHPTRAEASLWRRLRFEAETECRETLFNRYVPLARAIAAAKFHQRRGRAAERSDCEHFAYEGLLQAIDRFDPLLGVPFSAYARRRIVGSITDGLAKMSEVNAQISHRHRVEQERLRSLAPGEAAGQDPLSALSDLAVGLALGLMLEGTALVPANGVDSRPTAYESLEWREMQAQLAAEVQKLPEKEAVIIRQHYHNGLSLAQIADLLDLSRGRISQLHRSALERLRKRIGAF
ncbi:MAG TPA: sigma-70 family RNA polymerase sigma factor [Allosphingosinicella sp.]